MTGADEPSEMTPEPSGTGQDAAVEAWVALVRAQRRALERVETALKAAGLPSLTWYDALLELGRAPDGLRQGALEAAMLLEQYNVSRLIDRLTAAGLVDRRPDPDDGRARLLTLTPAGKAMARRIWPIYREALQAAFALPLSEDEARQLARLLRKVAPLQD